MDSILASVKKDLGIAEDYEHFDPDIIMAINTAFSILHQLGAGPDEGFSISDDTAVWTDFIPDLSKLEMVKTYVSKKVRMMFDPPTSSPVAEATNNIISELEWRINVAVDPKPEE
jgi:hypothetical protein